MRNSLKPYTWCRLQHSKTFLNSDPHVAKSCSSLSVELHSSVSAVHNKPANYKQSQMSRQSLIQNDDSFCLVQDWRQEARLLYKCSAYCDEIISMFTEFQLVRDELLGRLSKSRRCIKVVGENTEPAHSALYLAKPNIREFENFGIEKMSSQMMIEPAQTEWEPTYVFAPRKKGTFFSTMVTTNSML